MIKAVERLKSELGREPSELEIVLAFARDFPFARLTGSRVLASRVQQDSDYDFCLQFDEETETQLQAEWGAVALSDGKAKWYAKLDYLTIKVYRIFVPASTSVMVQIDVQMVNSISAKMLAQTLIATLPRPLLAAFRGCTKADRHFIWNWAIGVVAPQYVLKD